MASSATLTKVAFVAAIALALVVGLQAQNPFCNLVKSRLGSCIPYLKTKGSGPVPAGCCTQVRTLNAVSTLHAVRRAICICLKQIIPTYGPGAFGAAASVPGKCGVKLPFKITKNLNCDTVI
ncbi:hypothetical protein Nepgr_028225 [Nepenthes gracilis]|uniref:Non-specific lipid-transfer protein n=1 Tax=Nepenthes gracilis TaxID=150966 RepID=A0AAD3Y1X4_NEPGR|nr:hypothetical protein Nepgr_028225 [Nepenthes gracilis]